MQVVHEIFSLNVRNIFFNCKGDQTLKVVAQRGYGVAILGNIQILTGHCPRPLALADPTSAGGSDKMIFKGASPPQQLCDSVTLCP